MATPYVTVHLTDVTSTQDAALAEVRKRDGSTPVLVTADRQSAGRGRSGRPWEQATVAVFASLAWLPGWAAEDAAVLPLVAGLAVRSSVELITERTVTLKWPNDVLIGAAKVAGVLVERHDDVIVAGCGVNLWWDNPVAGGGSVLDDRPAPGTAATVADEWAAGLLDRIGRGPSGWGRGEYLEHCSTVGMDVTWEPSGRGTAVGIDERGGLVVMSDGLRTVLRAGEVGLVRPARFAPDV